MAAPQGRLRPSQGGLQPGCRQAPVAMGDLHKQRQTRIDLPRSPSSGNLLKRWRSMASLLLTFIVGHEAERAKLGNIWVAQPGDHDERGLPPKLLQPLCRLSAGQIRAAGKKFKRRTGVAADSLRMREFSWLCDEALEALSLLVALLEMSTRLPSPARWPMISFHNKQSGSGTRPIGLFPSFLPNMGKIQATSRCGVAMSKWQALPCGLQG